jgi:uncharacterized RmlC-like cupin family protein
MTEQPRPDPPPDQWHRTLRHIRGADLSGDTNQTTGMTRLEAVSGRTVGSTKVWMGQTHVAPHTNSGDHHHGATETAIYVLSGHPSFVFADGDEEVRVDTEPGDYVFVPPTCRIARRTRRARRPSW